MKEMYDIVGELARMALVLCSLVEEHVELVDDGLNALLKAKRDRIAQLSLDGAKLLKEQEK